MKQGIAEEVTNQILEDLEKGVMPWEKPWDSTTAFRLPVNASTGKAYRGINVFILWKAVQRSGFSNSIWLSFNQAKGMGGSVKKGEKGTSIVFYKRLTKTPKLELDDEVVLEEKAFWVLRRHVVFNLDQIEGLDNLRPKEGDKEPFQGIEEADGLLVDSGAEILHYPINQAFYNRKGDFITLPLKASFKSREAYYGTALHELTHWTGHETRLKREFGKRYGDQAYAVEELVAEMGAAFLCVTCGIPYSTQHASYIHEWIQVLKDHKRAIFTASAKAQAAMDFILKKDVEEVAA